MRPIDSNLDKQIKQIKLPASSDLDQRIDTLIEQSAAQAAPVFADQRLLARNPVIKYAMAAAMLICISLTMILWDNTSSPAFGMAEITAAITKMEWMHMTYTYAEPGQAALPKGHGLEVTEPEIVESWLSVNPRRSIQVYKNGDISYSQYTADQIMSQKYDAKTNVLTTRYISISVNSSHTSIIDKFLGDIAALEKRGATVEHTDGVYDGRPAMIMNVDGIDDNDVHFTCSLTVDIKTHLPKQASSISEKNGKTTTACIIFDYPYDGPTDVYQAGAPKEAEVKVIGQRITPGFLDAIGPYRAARERLPQQRIVVDIADTNGSSSVVSVEYAQRIEKRIEQLRYTGDDSVPDTEDFHAILDWANTVMPDKRGNYKIQLNDGTIVYAATRDYYNPWTSERFSLSRYGVGFIFPTGLTNRGWPKIRTGMVIENDFAAEHNFLCIETTREPEFTGDSKLVQAAEKTLYYIDPEHDYMCARIERFRHPVVPPWGGPAAEEMPVPDATDIPSEPYLVTEVVQFGRADTGHWYPNRIRTIDAQAWSDFGRGWEMREKISDIRLYIDTEPEFPEGIFDAENMPKKNK
jgi:hypothetical protein